MGTTNAFEGEEALNLDSPELAAQADALLSGETAGEESQTDEAVESPEGSAENGADAEAANEATDGEEVPETDEPESPENQQEETESSAIEVPKALRDLDRDALQTDEAKAVYDLAEKARKQMEADYTRKTQEISQVRRIGETVSQYEEVAKQIATQIYGAPNATNEDSVRAAMEHWVKLHTDPDYQQQLVKSIAGGQDAEAGAADGAQAEGGEQHGDDRIAQLERELEQLKNQQVEEQRRLQEEHQRAEALNKLTENLEKAKGAFKHFTDDHWALVMDRWVAQGESDTGEDLIVHAQAVDKLIKAVGQKKAEELVQQVDSAAPVGAGASGDASKGSKPEFNSIEEATQHLLSQGE